MMPTMGVPPTAVVAGAEQREAPGHPVPTVQPTNGVHSRFISPDGASLWLVRARLDDGATLRWSGGVGVHGDEALYVVSGTLAVHGDPSGGDHAAGGACPADGR